MNPQILDKYKVKKRIGKGTYGEVYLAVDQKGDKVAIKVIAKANIDETNKSYLQSEINCMKQLNDQNFVKIYNSLEDDTNYYIICEYCEGGDLFNHQAKISGKKFKLDQASNILSQVIWGLESMHTLGYLHRDIKSQNILIKKAQDKEIFKLADFGFAKLEVDINGTILGTQKFMAPQIFDEKQYGFEVDMWAFGVLFFFLLNAEYPFNLSPYLMMNKKSKELQNLASNFSYKKTVEQTRSPNLETCTSEVEDLFKKIFLVNQNNRIKFSEIRQHPVFKKYFKNGAGNSKILYNKNLRFQSKISKIGKVPMSDVLLIKPSQGSEQKTFIEGRHSQFKYLIDSEEEILQYSHGALEVSEILCLRYCLMKLFVIYLSDLIQNLNIDCLQEMNPSLNWTSFCNSKEMKTIANQYKYELSTYQMKLSTLYTDCDLCLPSIKKFNEKFENIYEINVSQQKSGAEFMKVYKKIARICFQKLQVRKNESKNCLYLTIIVTICYFFNKILTKNTAQLHQIFKPYLQKNPNKNLTVLDFQDIRSWIRRAPVSSLQNLFNNLVSAFLPS